jgi:type IV secretory pathway VirB10-like protein
MQQKNYPPAIQLRKSLVSIAAIGLLAIMLLVFYNLYQASQHIEMIDDNKIQHTARQSDIAWINGQKIATVSIKPAEVANVVAQELVKAAQPIIAVTIDPETAKAMSAPISNNQLLAEKNKVVAAENLNTVKNALPEETDPNKQGEKRAFLQLSSQMEDEILHSALQEPVSTYILQAGSIIPGILLSGINSDLPGQISAQVRANVYDSIAGNYLLIPQGAKITGLYDAQIAYGQERVLIAWKRIIFPNGKSIDLQGMPGVDLRGYAGFYDQIDNHYSKIFGSVILLSLLSAGGQLAQPQNSSNPWQSPTVGQTVAQSLGTNLANTGIMLTNKNINIQPTLQINPGYEFNISVTKDMVFPGPYHE